MVKKIFLLVVIFSLILIPSILAINTNINVKTLPNESISIIVLASDSGYTHIESFHKNSGKGDLTVMTSSDYKIIDVLLTLRRDGVNIMNERFYNFTAGIPITITFKPDRVEVENISAYTTPQPSSSSTDSSSNESNDSVNSNISNLSDNKKNVSSLATTKESDLTHSTEETENTTKNEVPAEIKSPVTSNAVANSKTNNYIIYAIIVFIVIVILVFLILVFRKPSKDLSINTVRFRPSSPPSIPPTEPRRDFRVPPIAKPQQERQQIKINPQEAFNKEIERQKLIKDAERKIVEDRIRLDRLRSGKF